MPPRNKDIGNLWTVAFAVSCIVTTFVAANLLQLNAFVLLAKFGALTNVVHSREFSSSEVSYFLVMGLCVVISAILATIVDYITKRPLKKA